MWEKKKHSFSLIIKALTIIFIIISTIHCLFPTVILQYILEIHFDAFSRRMLPYKQNF